MAKNSTIISVSCPQEMAKFIDEAGISASEAFQYCIKERKEMWDLMNNDKIKLIKAKDFLENEIQKLYTYLEEKKLFEEFRKWRGDLQRV